MKEYGIKYYANFSAMSLFNHIIDVKNILLCILLKYSIYEPIMNSFHLKNRY